VRDDRKMAPPAFRNVLRQRRTDAGLRQNELAERAGVSRQTLSAIEAGESVPATTIALQLARVLGCRVEEIFTLGEDLTPFDAVLIGDADPAPASVAGARRRVAVAAVDERWMAHLLDGDSAQGVVAPADGLLEPDRRRSPAPAARAAVRVQPLRQSEELRGNRFCAGCDPALALLAGHLHERFAGARLHWIEAGSGAALEMLARGEVHVAGLHLFDEESDDFNVAAVRRRFGGRAMVLVNLAVWEQGLVVTAGNPKKIRKIADLGRKDVRVMARERGTGSDELFTRLTVEEGIARKAIKIVGTARGHMAVASAVAAGSADVGITTRAAAASCGLEFQPLAEARFDLAMTAEVAADLRMQRMIEVLTSPRFRRDLGGLAGYGTLRTGKIIAELAA
jgi:putative molybdopterin biosynthesis protein